MRFCFNDQQWLCEGTTRIMAIVNVTPDSFSDGGAFVQTDRAVEHGLALAEAGADCLDIGGESSRPGAEPVSAGEEMARTIPVVRELSRHTEVPISIDTTKASVARAAVEAGAAIINDISAFRADGGMLEVLCDCPAGAIAMHMRGTPRTMQSMTEYEDLVEEVVGLFRQTLEEFERRDIDSDRLMFDPGIGFGKTVEQNLDLIAAMPRFRELGRPMLVGPSRKSFIGKLLGVEDPAGRDWGTAGLCAASVLLGADVVRVHRVAGVRDAVRMAHEVARRIRS